MGSALLPTKGPPEEAPVQLQAVARHEVYIGLLLCFYEDFVGKLGLPRDPSGTSQDCPGLPRTAWDCLGLPGTMMLCFYKKKGLPWTSQDFLRLPRTRYDFRGLATTS